MRRASSRVSTLNRRLRLHPQDAFPQTSPKTWIAFDHLLLLPTPTLVPAKWEKIKEIWGDLPPKWGSLPAKCWGPGVFNPKPQRGFDHSFTVIVTPNSHSSGMSAAAASQPKRSASTGLTRIADSDDVAQLYRFDLARAFRFDLARRSGMISPGCEPR